MTGNDEKYAYKHEVEHVFTGGEVREIQAFAIEAGVSLDAAIRLLTRLGIALVADTSLGARKRQVLVSRISRAVATYGETAL